MTLQSLLSNIALNEGSIRQIKMDVKPANDLALETAVYVKTGDMTIPCRIDSMPDLLRMEPAA